MDEIELSRLFIKYAETQAVLNILKAQIETEVLKRGETLKIAGITATYYKPSFETPDYESAAKASLPDDFDLTSYETITINTRWKDVCAALGLNVPPGKEKPARVIIK